MANLPPSQAILAGAALILLGILGITMLFVPIPAANATSLTFVLGALAGAITAGPASKAADRMMNPPTNGNAQPPPAP